MAHEQDQQNVPFIVGIGVFSGAFFVAFAIAVVGLFRWWDLDQRENKIVDKIGVEARTLKADQEASLGSYRLLDRETGRVSIPIDRAMDLILEEYVANEEGDLQ